MKLKVFSVYDGKIGAFMRPFFDAHTGNALRSFEEACKEPSSPFAKFSSDFVLYEIGVFDDESGLMTSHNPLIQQATSLEYARKHSLSLSKSKEVMEAANA